MRNSLTSYLILALGLIHPISMSFSAPHEDLEGSGYELDSSGFGSGDWSEEGEMEGQPNSKGTKNTSQGPSVLNFENTFTGGASGFVVLANSKSFLENKEIFAAVITGGVIGVVLAAVLAALLIYTWQKKDNGGYILGQQRASDEDYHRPNREVVFV